MKLLISTLSVVVFLLSCGSVSDSTPIDKPSSNTTTSESLDSLELKHQDKDGLLMTSSASLEPYENTQLFNSLFSVVISDSGDTTFWITTDTSFQTPEGYGIGTTWSNLPHDLKNAVQKQPGWGYYIDLHSGWNIAFCEGSNCTVNTPTEHSEVEWVFKKQ